MPCWSRPRQKACSTLRRGGPTQGASECFARGTGPPRAGGPLLQRSGHVPCLPAAGTPRRGARLGRGQQPPPARTTLGRTVQQEPSRVPYTPTGGGRRPRQAEGNPDPGWKGHHRGQAEPGETDGFTLVHLLKARSGGEVHNQGGFHKFPQARAVSPAAGRGGESTRAAVPA